MGDLRHFDLAINPTVDELGDLQIVCHASVHQTKAIFNLTKKHRLRDCARAPSMISTDREDPGDR
jgi:hypothetical protein